jgi:hypothetical protein
MVQVIFHTRDASAITISSSSTPDNGLSTKLRQRSTSLSNTFHQVVGFVQRQLSRTNDKEREPLVNSQEKD